MIDIEYNNIGTESSDMDNMESNIVTESSDMDNTESNNTDTAMNNKNSSERAKLDICDKKKKTIEQGSMCKRSNNVNSLRKIS